tara:strand:+ start:130 stop:831 length:702 start_codon:yes stop_codon:yes gene_type:complete
MSSKKNFIAIIPARGGSKEIKNKNMKNFLGKPLIFWTIEAALKSKIVSKIFLSSDSNKIINLCKKFKKIKIVKRPRRLATDSTPMLKVLKHIYKTENLKNFNFNGCILLQPTSPLRSSEDIRKSCKLFEKTKADSLISVVKLDHKYNPESIFHKRGIFLRKFNNKKNSGLRQLKTPYYSSNGAAIYITSKKHMNKFIVGGKKIVGYEMPENKSIDIDNEFDFKIGELIKKYGI